MKRIVSIILGFIIFITVPTYAFDTSLDLNGDIYLTWQSSVINNNPINYGLNKSDTDINLTLDINKKQGNDKIGFKIEGAPQKEIKEYITIITYDKNTIPSEAINKQGPFQDQNENEYWTYQIPKKEMTISTYGYIDLNYKKLHIKGQTNKYSGYIDTNLLSSHKFNESPGFMIEYKPLQDAKIKLSVNNSKKINAIIQSEYSSSIYDFTNLTGGIGYQYGDKKAVGAWAKAKIPYLFTEIVAEYGIQDNISALALFAKHKSFISGNISLISQDQGFISADDDTIIMGEKISENNADEVILEAAFRKYGYSGLLLSLDTEFDVMNNIKLGLLLNLASNCLDNNNNPIDNKTSYKVKVTSYITEDLALEFWFAAWGQNNITSIKGILYLNDFVDLSISYQMKELYNYDNTLKIQLTGHL